jgi:hypothetical protein
MKNRILLRGISYVLVLFVLILSGCEEQITQPSEFANKNLLRKQYSMSNINSYIQYYYNSSNKIIKIDSYVNTGLERRSEFYYDDRDNLIREDVYHMYYGVPEYYYAIHEYNNKGLLERSSYYLRVSEGTYEFRSFSTFRYDINNRIILESLHDTTGTETQHWEVFYDSISNVAEIKHYFGKNLIFVDKYKYDNNNNPLKLTNIHLEAQNLSFNNIIEHTQVNYNINDANYTHIYKYEYNENDYPISSTCTLDSTKVLYKIFYEYY